MRRNMAFRAMISTRLKSADYVRLSLIAIALLYSFFAGLRTVADFDLGWQLATGRYIVMHHSIPSTEMFSYTARGNPWMYPPFSGVILYALFLAGGFSALSWLSALACVATTALIAVGRGRLAAALAIVAVPAIAQRTIPRAELFTTIFFAAFATLLWRYYEGRLTRLWVLPLIMIAWVNLHPGFVAGLALIGAYVLIELLDIPFAGRRDGSLSRLLAAVPWFAATALATLVNPWGWKIYEAIARQSEMTQLHSDFIGEWSGAHFSTATWLQALSFRDPASVDWWMLAVASLAAVIALTGKEIGPIVILGVGAYASVTHIRLQGVFAILVCVVGGSILSRAWEAREGKATSPKAAVDTVTTARQVSSRAIAEWVLVAAFVLFSGARIWDLVTDRYYLWSAQITLFGTGPSWWFPERAITFLRQEQLPGNLFGDYNLGGYLTWRAGPEYPDYFDGRFIPFGSGLFVRHATLVGLPLDSPEWLQEASERNIQTAIFSVARFGGLGNFPLLANCQSENWTPVYLDDVAVIFVRNSPENSDLVRRLGIKCDKVQFQPPSVALSSNSWRASAERFQFLMNTASIQYVLARDSEAMSNLTQAEAIFADDPDEHFLKGQLAQAHGQPDVAERAYQTSIRLRPTDAAWFALAGLDATQRRYPEALHAVLESAALSQEPYDRYRSLGKLYLLMNRPQDALAVFAKAAHRAPYRGDSAALGTEFNARIAEGEAAAYRQLGDPDRAIARQLEAVSLTPLNANRWQVLADLYQSDGRADLAAQARDKVSALQAPPGSTRGASPAHQ
jgi:tetratricopeptide (TPR) repeat protein